MYLDIITLAIIVLAAYAHYRTGIWAAVVTLWTAALAAAVAFAFYLPVARAVMSPQDVLGTGYFWGEGLFFLLLFLVSFGALRLAAETVLKNSMNVKPMIDSLVGAAVGALSGFLAAGVFALFVEMLPLPPDAFGYTQFSLTNPGQRVGRLATRADDLVLDLYKGLSAGSLAGSQGGLGGHYVPLNAPAAQAGDPNRGLTADDIQYTFFRRRVEYAMKNSAVIGLADDKGQRLVGEGVNLVAGKRGDYSPGGKSVKTSITINKVWMSPNLWWYADNGSAVSLDARGLLWRRNADEFAQAEAAKAEAAKTPAAKAEAEKAESRKAEAGKSDAEDKPEPPQPEPAKVDETILFVQVTFSNLSKEPRAIKLNDFRLESVLRGEQAGEGRRRREAPREVYRSPKLIGLAKYQERRLEGDEGSGMKKELKPVELFGKGVPLLNGDAVKMEKTMAVAGLPQGADAVYVAEAAEWSFDSDKGKATATLAFVVPSLTAPWQYNLLCGYRVETASSGSGSGGDAGVFGPSYKDKFGPLNLRMKSAPMRRAELTEVKRKAAIGNEFMIATFEVAKTEAAAALLSAKDIKLVNTSLPKDNEYTGLLLVNYIKDKKTEAFGQKFLLNNADVWTKEAAPAIEEGKETGQLLSEEWQVYLGPKNAYAEITVAYEVPEKKPITQYKMKIAEGLSSEDPDWHLQRNAKKVLSGSHVIELAKAEKVESIKYLAASGRVREQKSSPEANTDVVVVTLAVKPKKADDKTYYTYDLRGLSTYVKLSGARKELVIFGVLLPGDENYRKVTKGEELLVPVHGESTEFSLAFVVTGLRESISIQPGGFKQIELK